MISNRYHFLDDYPSDFELFWTDELNGVAHDKDYWYFTNKTQLWKFPVGFDLGRDFDKDNPPTGIKRILDIPPELRDQGYNHFGDLDCYNGYLFVPIEGGSLKPVLAVFRAEDLGYMNCATLLDDKSAWCAINPINGWLYTSGGYAAKADDPNRCIHVYEVDVVDSPPHVTLVPREPLRLFDEHGNPITLGFEWMQGGVFSEDGRRLYLVSGSDGWQNNPDHILNEGIQVFSTRSGKRIAQSTNGTEPFNYEWHPTWSDYQEPEGLTIWDLDNDTRAHGIFGQLHVMMIGNVGYDALFFKHYRIKEPVLPAEVTIPPPFVERVAVVSAAPGLQPAGFARLQGCPDLSVTYEAWWETEMNHGIGQYERRLSCSKTLFSSSHEGVIFVIFGPKLVDQQKAVQQDSLSLELVGTLPDGQSVKILVGLTEAIDVQEGFLYYWGRFRLPEGGFETNYTLTMVITAFDASAHFSGRDPSGYELDANPRTIAEVDTDEPPYPFFSDSYEPGIDRNHTLEIAPPLKKDSLNNNKSDTAYNIDLTYPDRMERKVTASLTEEGEKDFFRISWTVEGEASLPPAFLHPWYQVEVSGRVSAHVEPLSGHPEVDLKVYDSQHVLIKQQHGSEPKLDVNLDDLTLPDQAAFVTVENPDFRCQGGVCYILWAYFETIVYGHQPKAIADWWERHHIPPGDPYFRLDKDYGRWIDEVRLQLERIVRTEPRDDQKIAATFLHDIGSFAALSGLRSEAESLYQVSAETFGRIGERALEARVIKDLKALGSRHG